MAKIIWTEEAYRWLKDIHDYISSDNPKAAFQTVSGIYQKIRVLKRFPEVGYIHRHADAVRILLFGHYRIAYKLDREKNVVILGIFHAALDISRYLV